MPKWLRKSLLVLVSVATFGLVTPEALLADSQNADKEGKQDAYQSNPPPIENHSFSEKEEDISNRDRFVQEMVKKAEENSLVKFGARIKPVIEDEFKEIILPNIEKAISDVAGQFPDEDLSQLIISEKPSGGQSEKIFHIHNRVTNKDVIRFHVRRDHPPKEAFVFNFHYHLAHDQFQNHYDLGVIIWDKNTPPKWMT